MNRGTQITNMRKNILLVKSLLLLFVLGGALMASGCIHQEIIMDGYDLDDFDDSTTRVWDIPYDGQTIFIDNFIGRIRIEGQDEPHVIAVSQFVTIEAVKRVKNIALEEIELEVVADDDSIQISSTGPDSVGRSLRWTPPFFEKRMGITEFTIRVPKNAEIMINQEVGLIRVENLGEVDEFGAYQGQLDVTQRVGDILIQNSFFDQLDLEQTYGDIEIEDVRFDQADVRTRKVGDIQIALSLDDSILIDAKTTLREISVFGIDLEGPEIVADMDQTWPGQELQLFYKSGDSRLSLDTGIGNIEIQFDDEILESEEAVEQDS